MVAHSERSPHQLIERGAADFDDLSRRARRLNALRRTVCLGNLRAMDALGLLDQRLPRQQWNAAQLLSRAKLFRSDAAAVKELVIERRMAMGVGRELT